MSKVYKDLIPFEHELDKSASKYTKEEIELLKQDFMNASSEEASYLSSRRDYYYGDGRQLTKMLYAAMTKEEKMEMLRKKQEEKAKYGI